MMAIAFSAEASVARDPDSVWTALTDWDRAHEWMGVDWVKIDGETAAGTKLRFSARGKERPAEIAAIEPGRLLLLRSVQGGVTADYTYSVEPAPNGSRISLVAECRASGLGWIMISPLLRLAMRWTDRKQVEKLKQTIEDTR